MVGPVRGFSKILNLHVVLLTSGLRPDVFVCQNFLVRVLYAAGGGYKLFFMDVGFGALHWVLYGGE